MILFFMLYGVWDLTLQCLSNFNDKAALAPPAQIFLSSAIIGFSSRSLHQADIASNTLDSYAYLLTKNQPTEDSKT